jgi:TNF receptor-associated protein 1
MSEPKKHEFQAEIQQLLDIVIHSIYTDKEVFIRELISNGADACEKLRFRQSGGNEAIHDADVEPAITVKLDEEANTIEFTDTGIGMAEADLVENLGTIAHSGTKAFLKQLAEKKEENNNLIGQFGVGFYSAFMAGDRVTVLSRGSDPEAKGYCWESEGAGGYTISEVEDLPRGTKVTVHLKEETKEFAKAHRVESVIKRYSNFVQFPITLGEKEVNTVQAIWARSKGEIKDEEYNEFYQFVSHDHEEPSYRLHYTADAPLAIQALLYVPKRNAEAMGLNKTESEVSLYCRRILIEQHAKGLLPDWLRFLKGVVDSEDLPLSLSRERMQDSALMEKLKQVVTKRFLKFLTEQSEKDADKFLEFYNDYSRYLKEGVLSDFAHQDAIAKLLRYDSSFTEKDAKCSLEEYVARMKDGQEEIYYLMSYNRETAESAPYYEAFKAKGFEVLFLYDPADEFVMDRLADYDGKKLISAEKAEIKLDDDADKEGLAADKSEALAKWLKEVYGDEVKEVRVSERLVDSPVVLLDGDAQMTATMRQIMQSMGNKGSMPALPMNIEINPKHSVIVRLDSLREENVDLATKIAEQLHDNARIMAGLMEDPRAMVTRLNELLEKVLEVKA